MKVNFEEFLQKNVDDIFTYEKKILTELTNVTSKLYICMYST